jgi:hypothetical protein
MQKVETADRNEARRCRIAQFSGRSRTLVIDGAVVFGLVESVQEIQTLTQPKWVVKISS